MKNKALQWTVKKRIKRFCADASAMGYHACPLCWEAYTYQPVLSPINDSRYNVVKDQTYICPSCAKDVQNEKVQL